MSKLRTLFSWLWVVLAVACTNPIVAREPVWNKQPCDHCRMLLSEQRYAAQLVDEHGNTHFFDDLGCMVQYIAVHRGTPQNMWVRDVAGTGWTEAKTARYASGLHSPMGFGFAAAHEGLSFDDVKARLASTGAHHP